VEQRRAWSLDQLQDELAHEADASRRLLDSLSESDMDRTFEHPRRGRITVAEIWLTLGRHVRSHLADLTRATGSAT
jgi:hypothetical protein